MTAAADALVAALASQRQRKVEVADGKSITIDTPSQWRASKLVDQLRAADGDGAVETLAPLFRSWDGISQVDVMGEGVGSSDPAPADERLFKVMLGDRPDWMTKLAMAAVELATEANKKTKAAAGN